MSQNYDISFYISWILKRKIHPFVEKLNEKTKRFIEKELELKVKRPIFSKKITPDDGNPCIQKFHIALQNFKHEDNCIIVHARDTDGIENFAFQDFGSYVLGQYKLNFRVHDKDSSGENYSYVLPILLNKIKKITAETNHTIIKVTGYRCHGEIKQNEELWPAMASTEF